MNWKKIKTLLTKTYNEWNAVEAPRMGASLSFYTMFSLAPLVLALIAIAGLVFGREAARGELVGQIQNLVGQAGADAIQTILKSQAQQKSSGTLAAVVGFVTLLFGASSVALELRSALDKIWHCKEEEGVAGFIKERSYALAVVLGAGFLLLVSLAVSAALATVSKFFQGLLTIPVWILQTVNVLISIVVIAAILAAIFKLLPAAKIAWSDVIHGAIFTSVLFTLGKTLIGIYLGKAAVGSSYGAAGSLVIVLIWIYYSAQILYFGAAFTRVYAQEYGSQKRSAKPAPKPVPAPIAQSVAAGGAALAAGPHSLASSVASLAGSLAGFAVFAVKLFKEKEPRS